MVLGCVCFLESNTRLYVLRASTRRTSPLLQRPLARLHPVLPPPCPQRQPCPRTVLRGCARSVSARDSPRQLYEDQAGAAGAAGRGTEC